MRILVAVSSDHWTSREAAAALGGTLSAALADRHVAADVDVQPGEILESVAGYDCVTYGRTIYIGRWVDPGAPLVSAPTVVFATGCAGATSMSARQAEAASDLVGLVGTRRNPVRTAAIGAGASTAADWASWVDRALSAPVANRGGHLLVR